MDEPAAPRGVGAAGIEHAAESPQAPGIETGDDDVRFRQQHARDFAQDLMGIVAELERVRQQHQVCAVGRDRKLAEVGTKLHGARPVHANPQRNAARAQEIVFDHPELKCIVAEHVGYRVVEIVVLAREQILTQRRRMPFGSTVCVDVH